MCWLLLLQLCEAAKGSGGDGGVAGWRREETGAGGDGRFGGRRHGLTVTAIHYGQIQSRPSWRTGGGRDPKTAERGRAWVCMEKLGTERFRSISTPLSVVRMYPGISKKTATIILFSGSYFLKMFQFYQGKKINS